MTAKEVQQILKQNYRDSHIYQLSNTYIYRWESDWFSINRQTKYAYEIEVKVIRNDFHLDFKKKPVKHAMLAAAYRMGEPNDLTRRTCPNFFYFASPHNVIDLDIVPEYAGLIHVRDGEMTIVKKAPCLHRDKSSLEAILLDKFYWQTINLRKENKELRECREGYESEAYVKYIIDRHNTPKAAADSNHEEEITHKTVNILIPR